MTVTLGLDLGPNSIGWALVSDEESRILGAGVRTFPIGVQKFGTAEEAPLNEQRRNARAMRRQMRRRKVRKHHFRDALVRSGLFPANPDEQERLHVIDPYELRVRAIDQQLELHELGRILLHLNMRRGFHSLRKHAVKDSDTSKMLAEMGELDAAIKQAGARTLGEYLHSQSLRFEHARPVTSDEHGENAAVRVRGRHTRRKMLEEEFLSIWSAQAAYYPDVLTEELCFGVLGRQNSLRKPIAKHHPRREGRDDLEAFGLFGLTFFQRPVYWPRSAVGLCELEPKQKRCPLAHRKAQRFRLLQEVNNLRYIDPDTHTENALNLEQRTMLLDYLATREKATFDQIRKRLGFADDARFNLEKAKRKTLKGMTTDCLIAKAVGKAWHQRPDDQKDAIVQALLYAEADEGAAMEELTNEHGLTLEEADALMRVDLPDKYAALSLAAIAKLLPHLEAGLSYMANDAENSALHAAGYLRRDQLQRRIFDQLPGLARTSDLTIGQIPNPVVKRALVELRKVVNAVIREYGKPDAIHVEMARSVKLGGRRRAEYIRSMRDREQQRERAAKEIRRRNLRPNRDAITKYLLWERQAFKCLYCGECISQESLFSGETDIDHILPRSRSLDDSQANKIVCHRRCNAAKGQRTVHEWLANAEPERYERICQQALTLVRKGLLPYVTYRHILQKNVDLESFTNRQLVDTGYIARATVEYLHCLFDADHAVLGLKGQYTAKLRRQWGLNGVLSEIPDSPAWVEKKNLPPGEKNRADHRHHVIDAIVVALTNRSRLHQLAAMWRVGGPEGIDRRTGELLEVPAPWNGFRDDVVAAVRDIKVSHRVRRRVSGGYHNDTLYGPVRDRSGEQVEGRFVVRKPVESLTKFRQLETIRDNGIRRIIMRSLAEAGQEQDKPIDKKVWKRVMGRLAMPSGVPIKKVRVFVNDKTIRPIRQNSPGQAWVKLGSNHHVCVFEWPDGGKRKRDMVAVSRLEAARRIRAGETLIQQSPPRGHPRIPPHARFVMSLSAGEMVLAEHKGREKLLVFKTAASTQRQMYFVEHTDARPSRDGGKFALKASTLNGRKVTVDTLGRMRWAND